MACVSGKSYVEHRFDICFKEDFPGASDRHVEYTPVRCSDPSVMLAQPVGGEFATLEFKRTDTDDAAEFVVSSEFWCRWGFEPCLYPTRATFRISGDRENPAITLVSEERLTPSKEFR
jgi:hypothetical protein